MSLETMEFGPVVVAFHDRVLRPRPWTMIQASWAADLSPGLPPGPVLEVCAGAGHIGQAAAALTGRHLVQVDVEPQACALAEANARANLMATRVDVRCAELEDALDADERFPLILADPPYVPQGEVLAYPDDPDLAINGGPDGLRMLRRCVRLAGAHVQPHGAVLLQLLGAAQVEGLAPELHDAGLDVVDVRATDDRRAVAHLRPRTDERGTRDTAGSGTSWCE
ncbi:methyltransferase [Cellulomonas bogoriensis]|uniref:Modification methylase HemK n=1 Tax=Cellulomonas bogoriensis 69B4 = DSM 16987 TaxID=1386082 RepID=A0A0A0C0S2_9CELL|nr:methyltransferase [Cellulomonas bogoriensis]KGM13750.1 modification methylase HemK [Cellulomonas bogoriensis 69B4 = DSM 16987]